MTTPEAILREHYFEPDSVTLLLGGRINRTFRVTAAGQRWVLQSLPITVFPEPAAVTERAAPVLEQLAQRAPGWAPRVQTARSGALTVTDAAGLHWRLLTYLEHAPAPALRTAAQVEAVGQAYGRTQRLLAELRTAPLPPLIPDHLDLAAHLGMLSTALAGHSKLDLAERLLRRGTALAPRFAAGQDLIHGDAKLANLLFDAAGVVVGVVDWDTLMTGHWALDFGDLCRSVLGHCELPATAVVTALARGFLAGAGRSADTGLLWDAARYVTVLLAIRYLNDHLAGDRYFQIETPGDNLKRALVQEQVLARLDALG